MHVCYVDLEVKKTWLVVESYPTALAFGINHRVQDEELNDTR